MASSQIHGRNSQMAEKPYARNTFLNRVGMRLRRQRPFIPPNLNFSYRIEQIASAPFVSMWFRTRGCKHDYRGGCTMCNYGVSTPVSPDEMIESVREGLSNVPDDPSMFLLVSPSGSMLDDWEVPEQAHEEILRLVQKKPSRNYICETRAETVTDAKVKRHVELLHGKQISIEMGLESSNPWIMQYCVNKALSPEQYLQAITTLHRYDISTVANIVLGIPFLSPLEAINDTVSTVKWALSHGTDTCVVFPIHVKQWTLAEWLWKHGMYSPPSLWSLVDVLTRLGPSLANRVTVSWYKVYREKVPGRELDPVEELGYLASPSTCPLCYPTVINLLDAFRDTNDYRYVEELNAMQCSCKSIWRESIVQSSHLPLLKRITNTYEILGREIIGHDWWNKNGEMLIKNMTSM